MHIWFREAGEWRREKEAVEQQTNELTKRLRNVKVGETTAEQTEDPTDGSHWKFKTPANEATHNFLFGTWNAMIMFMQRFLHFARQKSQCWSRPLNVERKILKNSIEFFRIVRSMFCEAKFSKAGSWSHGRRSASASFSVYVCYHSEELFKLLHLSVFILSNFFSSFPPRFIFLSLIFLSEKPGRRTQEGQNCNSCSSSCSSPNLCFEESGTGRGLPKKARDKGLWTKHWLRHRKHRLQILQSDVINISAHKS